MVLWTLHQVDNNNLVVFLHFWILGLAPQAEQNSSISMSPACGHGDKGARHGFDARGFAVTWRSQIEAALRTAGPAGRLCSFATCSVRRIPQALSRCNVEGVEPGAIQCKTTGC
jgi:hypothetical protein